ncbi:MAG: site-specific integrase [Syntrophomonas sp.]
MTRTVDFPKKEVERMLSQIGISMEEIIRLKKGYNPYLFDIIEFRLIDAVADFGENGMDGKSDGTKKEYKKRLNGFLDWMLNKYGPEILVHQVSLKDCEDYVALRRAKRASRRQKLLIDQEVAPPTNNLLNATLRTFFKYAGKNHWIITSPMDHVAFLPGCMPLPTYLYDFQCVILMKVAKQKRRYAHRDFTLVCFGIFTGARIEEIKTAQVTDIDFRNNTITLQGVKAGGNTIKERSLPLMGDLKEILKDWVTNGLGYKIRHGKVVTIEDKHKCLFPNLTKGSNFGQPMIQENIRHILERLFKVMNLELKRLKLPVAEGLTPHSLRHTFALLAVEHGINATTLQKFMGHKLIQSTLRYTDMRPEDHRKWGEKYNPFINVSLERFLKDMDWVAANGGVENYAGSASIEPLPNDEE